MAKNILKSIRDLFVRNLGLKLLAIALAALSFYAIRGAISFEVRYTIPVEVKVEKGIAILDQNPRQVDVTFRGSQENLGRLDQKYMRAVVRPRMTASGEPEFISITPGDIQGAPGVRVIRIRPEVVTVTFDREHTKLLPVVAPKTIGKPLIGTIDIEWEPRFVTIRGPRLRLRDTTSVSTEPVDVDGRVESFSKQVRVLSPGENWVSQIEPPDITVRVNIVTETSSRKMENVPVLAVTEPGKDITVQFDPAVVQVTLLGRAEEIDAITSNDIQVFVNCVGLQPGATYELPVQVHLPANSGADSSAQPQAVKARVSEPPPEPAVSQ